jgi:hypothetical protein
MFITKRLYEKPEKNAHLKQLIDLEKDKIIKNSNLGNKIKKLKI